MISSDTTRSVRRDLFARIALGTIAGAISLHYSCAATAAETSALSDEPIPMLEDADLPPRTGPLVEIGPSFLNTGNIGEGFELPTGAYWQPALWLFGNARTGLSYFDNGPGPAIAEWASSVDLFANLHLSGTERVLLGISPLDKDGRFTTYTFKPDDEKGGSNAFNANITTLFFEGEVGEIFPRLDPADKGIFDIGFAVGRQPIEFQDGIMFNDTIDSIGITRDTIITPGVVDTRATFLFGWGDVERDDNRLDRNANVFGLFTETDFRKSTVSVDAAYVSSKDSDGIYLGVGAVQRIGLVNTTVRVNTSFALDGESAAVSDGTLLFAEVSYTPAYSQNVIYGNAYWGIDEYSSAARGPTAGGPLGRTGILFAAVGLGRYGSALSNRPDKSVGAAIGYQAFFNGQNTQAVLELGVREDTDGGGFDAAALGTRLQHALDERTLVQVDAFAAANEGRSDGVGVRTELQVQF